VATRRARARSTGARYTKSAKTSGAKMGKSAAFSLGLGRYSTGATPGASNSHYQGFRDFQNRKKATYTLAAAGGLYLGGKLVKRGQAEYRRRKKRKKAYRQRRDARGKFR
jgi:hypothetical protein